MAICIICEGSYPYVSGGVSSWINQIIDEMKDEKFKIVSIMPSRKENITYKYKIHPNIIDIKTIYLNDYLDLNPLQKPKKSPKYSEYSDEIKKFFKFDKEIDWKNFLKIMSNDKLIGNSTQFLKSRFFWEIILEIYNESYNKEGFNSFFWTLRSMYIPFINLIQTELPEADIYHSVSTGYAGIIGLLAKYKYNKPLILTEHGIYAREREEEILKADWVKGIYKRFWIDFFYYLSIGAYKNSDKVISLFERNRNIQIELGSNVDDTIVIPNGVDIERFNTDYIKNETYNIGAILRVVPIKDVKTLIRSFRLVKSKVNNSKLYLIGPHDEDKDYYNECLKLVKSLSLENEVIFTGSVDVKEYIKIMDVLVLTSISEGQPLVILEGMASGVPFVSTDVGSCKELLEGREDDNIGLAGFITKPVSPKETANALIKLNEDDDLRYIMGLNGRKRIEKYYTKELFISNYKKIYEDLR